MDVKKIAFLGVFVLLFSCFLSAQDLVELAKKEKERRESLKGKKGAVITNADLGRVTKKPAFALPPPPETTATEAAEEEGEEAALEEGGFPPEIQTQEQPTPPAAQVTEADLKAAEEKWNATKELVDLFSMKMNGLWQEFYSLDDMMARDEIQKQISDTYQNLLKAQEEETKARLELDKLLARVKKDAVPQIWIR